MSILTTVTLIFLLHQRFSYKNNGPPIRILADSAFKKKHKNTLTAFHTDTQQLTSILMKNYFYPSPH